MTGALHQIPITRIDGTRASVGEYAGKVALIVNVASKCGLTPQYKALETIYETYRDRGLVVLGFPANNFAGQEPGTDGEIQTFCSTNYNVQFPLFSKISVKGADQHPLYAALTAAKPERTAKADSMLTKILNERGLGPTSASDVMWNFEKFLVDRKGRVVERFAPDIAPDDPLVTHAIETALATP